MSWWSKAKERQKTNTVEVQLLKGLIANQHFITDRMETIAKEISGSLMEIRKATDGCKDCHEKHPCDNPAPKR
ncbi:hypothetical protein BH789_gp106 [Gordonia phage GMA6]|uniref:Uncharacterized protein n=1 Tax=Gordonia phage GMA6 TaxID=1647285 RepID=A0A0K0NLF7_9CAUD|nr:hypothetical protein BH789_gp106 [Gordonia phage GMA6]AKL88387.1 hypothetical protein GMA6_106 [Gordonia phage GMA6]